MLNADDPDNLDTKALTETIRVSVQTLEGLVNQLKHNPNLRKELEELGYLDEQIPSWVARPLDIPKGAEELVPAGTSTIVIGQEKSAR